MQNEKYKTETLLEICDSYCAHTTFASEVAIRAACTQALARYCTQARAQRVIARWMRESTEAHGSLEALLAGE